MEVQLLVYDLSQGLARQMSQGFLGFHLDAIYHTSILLNGREWVYDGGIVDIAPGSSHLGQPMERLPLGTTELPMDVIEQFVDSMRPVFTAEAYDLMKHNCNNWSDTFANFLLGSGIPDHIINMPSAVMQSPMGQMLMPQLAQMTGASRQNGGLLGLQGNGANGHSAPSGRTATKPAQPVSKVKTPSNLQQLETALHSAKGSCAVIFFTSATCPPCKTLYPLYEELANELASKAVLIKVDISQAMDVGTQYAVRATPTFMTFLRGEKENQWTGADPSALRGNVQLLAQMAWPSHPHDSLNLPSFSPNSSNAKPVLYSKIPPMPKLLAKMGDLASNHAVQAAQHFIQVRAESGAAQAVLPNMKELAGFMHAQTTSLPRDALFPLVDLFRCLLIDPRVSGYFAEEHDHQTVAGILGAVNGSTDCPYALRLVTLQMTCNLFSTPLYSEQILHADALRSPIIQLISSSFLDESHSNVRVAASSLMYNVALANGKARREHSEKMLPEADQVELVAAVLEAIGQEEASPEALQGMLLALGHMTYGLSLDGELADLLRVMDAEGTVTAKKKDFKDEKLVGEVGSELLGKGLRRQ